MKLTKRMDKIEIRASSQIQNALEEMQRLKKEKAQREYKAYRWSAFGEWCYQNHRELEDKAYAARSSIPEEPVDETLECNGGKISCDECGGCQMPLWDEDVDISQLSPEHRANWLEYLQLFFSTPDEELDKAENIWMADILKTTPDDPQLSEKIAALQARIARGNNGEFE